MNSKSWKILNEILELDPKEWEEALTKLVEGDNSLVQLKRAIQNIEEVEDWWEKSKIENISLLEEISTDIQSRYPENEALLGEKFGPYTISELVAEGGMGRVFSAVRSDGYFDRKVAIKLISYSISEDFVKGAFKEEQKILGSLNHPGIAQLYDASITENGVPFFVMEWAEGKDVISYAESRGLDIPQRLRLFNRILDSVGYAHKNLVVHRDLKPSNIIVTENNDPKILDFGISKILHKSKGKKTNDELKAVTLAYASPEQILNNSVRIPSDIYSLGMLLFELLAGEKPINLKGLKTQEVLESLTKIERPKLSEVTNNNSFIGDLDSIVAKAISLDPEQRYNSAQEFKEDINCYLENRVVLANEVNSIYRIKKFWARNKWVSLLTSILLITVITFGLIYYVQINKERETAVAEAKKATVTKDYLLDLFKTADPLNKPGQNQTVADFLNKNIQNLSALDDEPEVKEEASYTLARVSFNLGDYAQAESLFVESYELNKVNKKTITFEQADILDWIGNINIQLANYEISANYFDSSLSIKMELLKPDHIEIAESYSLLSSSLAHTGNIIEADSLIDMAIDIFENSSNGDYSRLISAIETMADISREKKEFERSVRILETNVDLIRRYNSNDKRALATALNNLGYSQRMLENYESAQIAYGESLSILEDVFGESHPSTLTVMANLGGAYSNSGNYDKANEVYLTRLSRIKNSYGENHWRVGQAHTGLGGFFLTTKNFEQSESSYLDAVNVYEKSLGKNHFWTLRAKLYQAMTLALIDNSELGDSLLKESLNAMKTTISSKLSYYDYSGLERLLTSLNEHNLSYQSNKLSDFLSWYNSKYTN